MAEPAVITINRNSNFHSIQVDAAASVGMMTNSLDVKIGGDLTIKGANSISTTLAGVKMEAKLLGVSIEAEFGNKLKFVNGANLCTSTADGEAFLNEAKVHLAKLRDVTAKAEQAAVQTEAKITAATRAVTIIDGNGVSLNV